MVWLNNSKRNISSTPMRIISLVPSLTELLYDLGLDDRVVGITRFCLHPAVWQKEKKKIGGTKKLNIADIKLLHPDLIIASKEENVKEQVEELSFLAPVLVTDINDYASALEAMHEIGRATQAEEKAQFLISQVDDAFTRWSPPVKDLHACYLIWQHPYMVSGGDTYISSMLQRAGFKNVFSDVERYPTVSLNDIAETHPDFVFLSSEPYPFTYKHVEEWQEHLPGIRVELVDGEMFSWYGTRMLKVPHYFNQLWQRLLQ